MHHQACTLDRSGVLCFGAGGGCGCVSVEMEYDEIVGLVRDGYEVCSPAYKETKDDAVLENALFVRWQSELVRDGRRLEWLETA